MINVGVRLDRIARFGDAERHICMPSLTYDPESSIIIARTVLAMVGMEITGPFELKGEGGLCYGTYDYMGEIALTSNGNASLDLRAIAYNDISSHNHEHARREALNSVIIHLGEAMISSLYLTGVTSIKRPEGYSA
jgi:hypothetical protein